MKQWRIQTDRSLQLMTVDTLPVLPRQVSVQVRAIGINRADLLQVKGFYPPPAGFDPAVPGLEFAGVVTQVGAAVDDWWPGARVMGLVPGGAYAEHLIVPANELIALPEGLDFAAAATLPEAFLTAYRALFMEGKLPAGEACLIRPATSSIGLAAVQLARAKGNVAIGSSRNPQRLQAAREFGLTGEVSEGDDWSVLQTVNSGKGVAVVLDQVGSHWQALLGVMQPEGRLVSVGVLGSATNTLDPIRLLMQRQSILAMTMRSLASERRVEMAQIFQSLLLPWFQQQVLRPLPLTTFPFQAAPAALEHLRVDGFIGKRVLVLD